MAAVLVALQPPAKAAAKAIPPHENATENPRWVRAVQSLRDAITTDDSDEDNFYEYMQSRKDDVERHEKMLKGMTRWPRLRKYWPRLRRRTCSYCGTCTLDHALAVSRKTSASYRLFALRMTFNDPRFANRHVPWGRAERRPGTP